LDASILTGPTAWAAAADVAAHLIVSVSLPALRDGRWSADQLPPDGGRPAPELSAEYHLDADDFAEAYPTRDGVALIATGSEHFVVGRGEISGGTVDTLQARIIEQYGELLDSRDIEGSGGGSRVRVMTVGFEDGRFAVVTVTYPSDGDADRQDLQATLKSYRRETTDGR